MPYLYTPAIQQLRFELNNVLGSMKDIKAHIMGCLKSLQSPLGDKNNTSNVRQCYIINQGLIWLR